MSISWNEIKPGPRSSQTSGKIKPRMPGLDRLVEKAYGKSFDADADRVAFLFERYRKLTADLFTEEGKKARRARG